MVKVMNSLLRGIARRPERRGSPAESRYDAATQTSLVLEGDEWVPSWESSALLMTKKMDHETGEDSKGQ